MKKVLGLILLALMTTSLAACGLFGEEDPIVDPIVDCITNPDAEGCEPDPDPDPTDERTAEEIAADLIIDNWTGDVAHLSAVIDNMDLENAMELIMELDLEIIDGGGETHTIVATMTDRFIFLEGETLVSRELDMDFDGEEMYFHIIFEEVASGVIVYVDVTYIRERLTVDEPDVMTVVDTLGITHDWLMLSFDDSLVNLIEVEVMREILADVFFGQMGELFFYTLADDIETDTGLVLADYELYIGLMMDNLATGEYDLFKAQVDAILWDDLIFDLDEVILVPILEDFLTRFTTEFTDLGWDVPAEILYIQTNGTELWLGTLSDAEMEEFLNMIPQSDSRLLELTIDHLRTDIPWQVVSAITLPTTDPETGATIIWSSNNPAIITDAGVVTPPVAGDWDGNVELIAEITVGDETRHEYFYVFVPPVDATDVFDEYNDYYYEEQEDPLGDYLKETVDLYEVILLFDNLKDNLILIDFEALFLEEIDHLALIDAIYDGQVAYDLFVTDLAATAPEASLLLSTFSPVAGYVEEFVFITDVRYAIDNMTMFEDYLTLDFYIDNGFLDVTLAKTTEFDVETTVALSPDALGDLFIHTLGDVETFLFGFTDLEIPYIEHLHCPVGETCEELEDYDRIVERLNLFSNMDVVTTFNPSDPSEIITVFDFTDFADAIVGMDYYDDELLRFAVNELWVPEVATDGLWLPTEDLANEATISWHSSNPAVIATNGMVTRPAAETWEEHVELTATVTVGTETEFVHFWVMVPPMDAHEDWWYDDDNNNGGGMGRLDGEVVNFVLTITVKDTTTITVPTTGVTDMNAVAQEFAKFSLTLMTQEILKDIAQYYIDNPTELITDYGTTRTLESYGDAFYVTLAFDNILSTVEMGTLLDPDYTITLYWVDGTEVFVDPLGYEELELVLADGEGPPVRAVYLDYVNNVDAANFNMTKLLFVYIFNDQPRDDDEYYEE